MARSPIPIVVLGPTGAPVAGATVTVQKRNTSTNSTVYSNDTTSATTGNPITTDAFGRANGWLDRGAYQAIVSAPGLTTRTEYFDSTPGADLSVDTAWLGSQSVTKGKINDDALPNIQAFTANGTWTKPVNAKVVMAVAIGGGGGGSVNANAIGGYGGFPGALNDATFLASSLPATVPITVGLGGSGAIYSGAYGTGGARGGDSTFGTMFTAFGGQGGSPDQYESVPTGSGVGGTSGSGGFSSTFGLAGGAAATSSAAAGAGTSAPAGVPQRGGGGGSGNVSSTPYKPGGAGGLYGGGGGGARNVNGTSNSGGNGGNGIVVVVSI